MNRLLTQLVVVKRVAQVFYVVLWCYYTVWKLDAFNKTERDKLLPKVQEFCQKLTDAIDLKVVRTNRVELPDTALWVSNHISWVDIAGLGSEVPAFFIAKAEIGKWPIAGPIAHASGTVLIKRGSGDAKGIAAQIAEFLANDVSVFMFPEGTTSHGRSIRRIHGKLLAASIESGKPVQPVVICYKNAHGEVDTAIPYAGDISFTDSIKRVLQNRGTTLYVRYLEPIYPRKDTELEALRLQVESAMRAGQAKLQKEVFGKVLEEEVFVKGA